VKKDKRDYYREMKIIVLGVILILCGLITFFYNEYEKEKNVTLYYIDVGTVKYKVCLKENKLFKEQCLKEGKEYLSDLIDYIDLDFQYLRDFKNNKEAVEINYNYSVDAITVITTDKGKIFKDVTEQLTSKFDSYEKDVRTKIIKETIKIDYRKYEEILDEFREENRYAKGDLRIILSVNMTINDKRMDKPLYKKGILSITIPLGNVSTSFEVSNIENIENEITEIIMTDKAKQYQKLYITFTGIGIMSFLLIVIAGYVRKRRLSPYERFMMEINSKYGEKITVAEKNSLINESYYQLIDVEDFNELFEQAITLNKNIVITKRDSINSIGEKVEVAWATVIDNKMMYRRVYSEKDDELK